MDFTGPRRSTNAGALASLNQKCCWRTTCKKTGMPNAYTVCALQQSDVGSESKGGEDTQFRRSRAEILTLHNGEKRVKIESSELSKRIEILRRYRLLPNDPKNRKKDRKGRSGGDRKGYASSGEDDYETDEFNDDAGEYGDDFDDGDREVERCQYQAMADADRREGLKFLEGFSRNARQEKQLQDLLNTGVRPSAPQLWTINHKDPSAESERICFSTELLIRWEPQVGDLISFFSLECSGPAGSGKGDHIYKEVYRDPPDANPGSEFSFQYRMSNLLPGTSYLFRMRAMNGYGSGDFVYKTFTTYPGAPLKPRIMKVHFV